MVIIDMKIPKNCSECPMNHGEYSPNEIEKRSCCLTHKQFTKTDYKKRPANCPIKKEFEVVFNLFKMRERTVYNTTVPIQTVDGKLCCDACGCEIKYGQTKCSGCEREIDWDK